MKKEFILPKEFASEKLCDLISVLTSSVTTLAEMNEKLQETLPALAEELQLGRLSVVVSNPQNVYEPLGINKEMISYESPAGFNPDTYEKFYFTEENGFIRLKANLLPQIEWTDQNKKFVDFYVDLSYLLCSRARLMNLMDAVKITDSLTGALNLHGLQETVGEILSKKEIQNFSVVLLNFKNFKYINQRVTTDNGDIILRKYSMLVQGFLEGKGYLARLGSDNFLTLVDKKRLSEFIEFIKNVSISVNNKGTVESIKIDVRAGVYETNEETTFGDIMSNSAVALDSARHSRNKDILFFEREMLEKALHDKSISNMFLDSLAKNEFKVYYQPKVDLQTNMLCGCEALSRWYAQRLITPAEFIPILEQEGTIKNLDFYVLETVCRNIREWIDKGIEPVLISTNFSKLHLSDDHFEEHIISTLKKYDVPSKYLELELTELSDYQYFERLVSFVNKMKDEGFKISIDDFGTGYSSMSLVRNLNPDVIKLDKSLIDNVAAGDDKKARTDRIISRSIIKMAQELGIKVIAEGVETKEQAEFLLKNDCFMAQGWLFDKALDHDEFEKRLVTRKYEI
ncbi:MAG: EAL domain-containing protein [Treponema sp.]|uniref:putative bifunctional diguanylate cyclase/phosphodiesterase n=1 Tax=Treponema sp. TaxID=166 RepID=UPI0025F0F0D2|nr:GGDEF domain-containing phosphodiesterase [Treponema sp.]MBQ8680892.1 EAL domain-containing protein [Treponema sp.]